MTTISATLTQNPKRPSNYFVWTRYMAFINRCRVGNRSDLELNEKIIHIKNQLAK